MVKLYADIDLGLKFHQVVFVDPAGQRIGAPMRIGRGRGGVERLLERASVSPDELVVSIEATANYWQELVSMLRSAGCEVYLISPKKSHDLRRFFALHTKTDITDAEALARMPVIVCTLKPVWVAPPVVDTMLRLCRLRWKYRCEIANAKRRSTVFADMVMSGLGTVMPLSYSKSARLFVRRTLQRCFVRKSRATT